MECIISCVRIMARQAHLLRCIYAHVTGTYGLPASLSPRARARVCVCVCAAATTLRTLLLLGYHNAWHPRP